MVPAAIAATTRRQQGLGEWGAAVAGPGNFQPWVEEAEEIMEAEAAVAVDSLLGADRPVRQEGRREFFPVAEGEAGPETTQGRQPT